MDRFVRIGDLLQGLSCPILVLSYEAALKRPVQALRGLESFVGLAAPSEEVDDLTTYMRAGRIVANIDEEVRAKDRDWAERRRSGQNREPERDNPRLIPPAGLALGAPARSFPLLGTAPILLRPQRGKPQGEASTLIRETLDIAEEIPVESGLALSPKQARRARIIAVYDDPTRWAAKGEGADLDFAAFSECFRQEAAFINEVVRQGVFTLAVSEERALRDPVGLVGALRQFASRRR